MRKDRTGFTKSSRAERWRGGHRQRPLKSRGGAEREQRRIGRGDRERTGARAEKSHGRRANQSPRAASNKNKTNGRSKTGAPDRQD
ncbi:hypothetical protein G5714_024215 [Onychostoma macrolepis]|uniref:Uncharacterized protein n=1 Tax=Onychostoma macrolepis TaxID=369639 RepID=A0A7J6BJ38_9TELE|nr:hypothetical protein G5714_024215 [Onychostoma macrolepis]